MTTQPTKADIWELSKDKCYVGLTTDYLSVQKGMDHVRSPKAGAILVFAGTTRDNFDGKSVKELQYSAYNKMALRSMMKICQEMVSRFSLHGIYMVHRLGPVPIGEESIVIVVSSSHRKAAWEAGEEALEQCKAKVEIWKKEEFDDGHGVWRANRDGAAVGEKIDEVQEETDKPKVKRELDLSQVRGPTIIGTSGSVVRPRRFSERGHGVVVNPRPTNQDTK